MAILFMYMSGACKQAAALGDGEYRERVRHRLGADRRAFERIDGDVDLRPVAVADLLADVEHRRFVHLALADDDRAAHGYAAELAAHGIDGSLVGGLLVSSASEARSGDRGRLGHPCDLENEHPIEPMLAVVLCHHAPLVPSAQPLQLLYSDHLRPFRDLTILFNGRERAAGWPLPWSRA